jgi:hypothetical protein
MSQGFVPDSDLLINGPFAGSVGDAFDGDPNSPARVFNLAAPAPDLASGWPGTPPSFNQQVVPHIFTVAGQVGLAGRAYLAADEALMHDPENAERMRADCGIMESVEARQKAVALLNWHLEPEDSKSQEQKDLCEALKKIISRTPRFVEMRRWLLEAVWNGRSGVALQFRNREIGGFRRIAVSRWEPRNGDKFVFRYDDGSGRYDPDQIGIRIGIAGVNLDRYRRQGKIEYTSQGMVYWFDQHERKRFILHKHMVEDGPFDQVMLSGRIHGVGIRTRIYWMWYQMVECMQRALEYLDRSAFGVELWRYPANNPKAMKATQEAATRNVGGGRSIVLVPVWTGDNADQYGVEHLEPGLAGVDALLGVIKDFYRMTMKRYIMGQTLTSEAEATGLGSGVADAHLATFADIVSYDARNLEETMTEDFVRHLQVWNFPQYARHYIRFVIDTESDDAKAKMESFKSAWEMGMEIKTADVADAIGISVPSADEDKLFNPQVWSAIQQAKAGGVVPGGMGMAPGTGMAPGGMGAGPGMGQGSPVANPAANQQASFPGGNVGNSAKPEVIQG